MGPPATQPAGSFGRLRVDASTGRIWVGHSFGLEWSSNGGASWTFLNSLSSVSELDAYNGRIAVIAQKTSDVADHIYVSADNGATWDEITRAGQRFANAEAVAVDPWRPGTIWISTGGRAIARFTPGSVLQMTSTVSRKTHNGLGPFDVNVPLTGDSGVESRNSGGTDALVFTFTNNIVSGNASVTSGTGAVSGTPVFAGNTMTVNLSGVADVQKISVTDSSAQTLPSTAVSMRTSNRRFKRRRHRQLRRRHPGAKPLWADD